MEPIKILSTCVFAAILYAIFYAATVFEDKNYKFTKREYIASFLLCMVETCLLCKVKSDLTMGEMFFWLVPIAAYSISFMVDIKLKELPDSMTFIALISAIIWIMNHGWEQHTSEIIISVATTGFMFLFAYFTNGFGMGDIKLILPLMLMLPVTSYFDLYLCIFVPAAIFGLYLLIKNKKLHQRFAFGPFMILGFYACIIGFEPFSIYLQMLP